MRDTATGEERGAVLIVDEADGSVTLHVDGRPALERKLAGWLRDV